MHNNRIVDKIIPLEREKWQGYQLEFRYMTNSYYDVEINRADSHFKVTFIKKQFDTPFEHIPDGASKLFESHWDNVNAWGIVEGEQLVAVIETAVEEWSNRLRVTNLWIDKDYHRKGIGTVLMDIAVKRAKDEKRRAIILETQTCNENAIAFYLSYGFTLIGFDTCCYGNNDLENKEVRIELGMLFET